MRWLLEFSHYIGRDLYLTGESYGGHYIPHIAKQLWDNRDTSEPRIPFKGFAIGNPWTDPAVDYRGEVDFWHSRALISTETYAKLTQNVREAIIASRLRRSCVRGAIFEWRNVSGIATYDGLQSTHSVLSALAVRREGLLGGRPWVQVLGIPDAGLPRNGESEPRHRHHHSLPCHHSFGHACRHLDLFVSATTLLSLFFHLSISPVHHFVISSFCHFAISPFFHFANFDVAISPLRHIAISPCCHIAISRYRHLAG